MDTIETSGGSLLIYGVLTVVGLLALGFPLRAAFRRLGVPPAVSLMAVGLLLGPDLLDLVPEGYSAHLATPLSRTAFAVLLVRAGFGLAPGILRVILGAVLAFGTLPVIVELAVVFAGGRLMLFEDARLCWLLAFMIAAVSPAVILPTMLDQKDRGRGLLRHVPDRIMGQTVVNAFIAQTGIFFTLGLLLPIGVKSSPILPAHWPFGVNLILAVVLGIGAASLVGAWVPLRPLLAHKAVATIAVSLLAVIVYFGTTELGLESVFGTLALGVMLRRRFPSSELSLRLGLRRVWGVAEIILFANLGMRIPVGALIDTRLIGIVLLILIAGVGLRIAAAFWMTRATSLDRGESTYVAISQIPKATIQAVFGALPLQRFTEAGMESLIPAGESLLIAAALAICVTAPVGAVALDRWASRLLSTEGSPDPIRN
jgi:Kef-type K+ transport system membrane component KefB